MIKDLNELLAAQLQKLYDIENQLIEILPKLAQNANSEELKLALTRHLETTKEQKRRLEAIGEEMGVMVIGKQDEGMAQILKEGEEMLNQIQDPVVKDAAIIGGAEKVEHYEIGAYESAKSLAKKLNVDGVAEKLDDTLGEEKKTAASMNMLSGGTILGKISEALS